MPRNVINLSIFDKVAFIEREPAKEIPSTFEKIGNALLDNKAIKTVHETLTKKQLNDTQAAKVINEEPVIIIPKKVEPPVEKKEPIPEKKPVEEPKKKEEPKKEEKPIVKPEPEE